MATHREVHKLDTSWLDVRAGMVKDLRDCNNEGFILTAERAKERLDWMHSLKGKIVSFQLVAVCEINDEEDS